MKLRTLVGLFILWPLLSGCYLKGSIEDLDVVHRFLLPSEAVEVNSGAFQKAVTDHQYQVGTTVGNITGNINTQTSDGYKIYMNVQGSVYSEDAGQE